MELYLNRTFLTISSEVICVRLILQKTVLLLSRPGLKLLKKKNDCNRQCSHLPLTQKQKKFIYSVTRATSLSLQIKIFNYFPIRSRSNYGSPFGRASTHKSQEFRHLGQIRCFISKYWNQASRTDTSFSSECVQNEAGGEEMGGTRKVWHKKKRETREVIVTRWLGISTDQRRGDSAICLSKRQGRPDKGGWKKAYYLIEAWRCFCPAPFLTDSSRSLVHVGLRSTHESIATAVSVSAERKSHHGEDSGRGEDSAWAKTLLKHSVCCLWAFKNLQKTHFYTQ